jgi:uncharacterized protein YihD (DUF1040 family)
MQNRIDILNELKALSPVIAGIEKVNVFTVPNGYFERLEEDILMGIKEETVGFLGSIKNQSSMQVPQGYFESLADNILSKIKLQDSAATELRDLSPMLYSIRNKNVFTVPQGYFETLPENILNTVAPQQAKLVTMQRRTVTILKYAVAAVFTGVMALGVYKFTNKNSIATSPDNAITIAQSEGLKIAKENRFEEEFAKVTDEEIVNFLTKDGVDVEAAVAITQMQDKIDTDEISNDKTESTEIDDLLNQLDENKTMN